MKRPRPVCVDIESFGIESRPHYPPAPCGVSVKWPGCPPRYFAFAHLEGNNATWKEARAAIAEAYQHPDGVLFQNAKFDVDVIDVHFNLPPPSWDKIHDTLFLLFLYDPNETELSLKPSASRLLGMPPEEQDAVVEWLVTRQPVPNVKISPSKKSETYAMKYVPFAPGELVGTYANGDVVRTAKLFDFLWPNIKQRRMLGAYDRERELMPILLEMERQGVPVSIGRLQQDVVIYCLWHEKVTAWICRQLKTTPDALNLDSGNQLMSALIQSGRVDATRVPKTKTGKMAFNKDALLTVLHDKPMLAMLKYRAQLGTCLQTFMEPWLETAKQSGGLIFTNWNQVKSPKGDDAVGTRTGRLSSNPNFQNIPKEFIPIFTHEEPDPKKAALLPVCPIRSLPSLPQVRSYVVPFNGHVLCVRDFSSQELRMLAHFEDGTMAKAYIDDPMIDFHQKASELISRTTGLIINRKQTKNIAFSILYGSGIGKLAQSLKVSVDQATVFRNAYLAMFPGIKLIQQSLKQRAINNEPYQTFGGREYYCEKPKLIDGRMREFSYKMLNFLIQGSSADQTKEAILRFFRRKPIGKLLLTVHDELLISAPMRDAKQAMCELQDAMEDDPRLSVPMRSDGAMGINWAAMKACA